MSLIYLSGGKLQLRLTRQRHENRLCIPKTKPPSLRTTSFFKKKTRKNKLKINENLNKRMDFYLGRLGTEAEKPPERDLHIFVTLDRCVTQRLIGPMRRRCHRNKIT